MKSKKYQVSKIYSKDCQKEGIYKTSHLLSIPGMRASIRKGLATPLSKAFKKPDW